MDQARVDSFLDRGWCLVGQLHRWLSKCPAAAHDLNELNNLIHELQRFWTASDDLALRRIGRTSLALEQVLERLCARTLVFSSERLQDVTATVESLQDLLLGLEATREEPEISELQTVVRVELLLRRSDPAEKQLIEQQFPTTVTTGVTSTIPSIPFKSPSVIDANFEAILDTPLQTSAVQQSSIDQPLVAMLEQFVAKIDDTCHRLHARITADEAPYAATTSRLAHLAQATRELVDQMSRRTEISSAISGRQLEAMDRFALAGTTPNTLSMNLDSTAKDLHNARSPSLPSRSSESTGFAKPTSLGETIVSRRLLVIEDSLFYQHLIGLALRSAGYEPIVADTNSNLLATFNQDSEFGAVLISTTISTSVSELIERLRRTKNSKVIRLISLGQDHAKADNFDAEVSRSHPQQLLAVLNRLLLSVQADTRLSA